VEVVVVEVVVVVVVVVELKLISTTASTPGFIPVIEPSEYAVF